MRLGNLLPRSLVGATLAVLLLSATPAAAVEVLVGPRVGTVLANLHGDDISDTSPRAGLAAGGAMTVLPIGLLGLSAEALYVQKGATGRFINSDVELTLHTLELPIFARVRLPLLPIVKPEVLAGGYVGFLLGASVDPASPASSLIEDSFRSTDLGWLVGLGLALDLKVIQPNASIRFAQSASTIVSELDFGGFGTVEPDVRNRTLTFMLGVDF